MTPITYRELHSMPELEEVVDLETAVWGMSDYRDSLPSNLMHALVNNSGLVVGAYEGETMVGFAVAFLAQRGRKLILWSHIAGVKHGYKSRGIGFALKQFQRTWALERGISEIRWTYDPLQAVNARFNIHYLGATANLYFLHFYGDMTDEINRGIPSDRVEAIWDLKAKRVAMLATGQKLSTATPTPELCLLKPDAEGQPQVTLPDELTAPAYFAAIPADLAALKRHDLNSALAWRLAQRQVFQAAFAHHYIATDFISQAHFCYYHLTRPQAWLLYVVECADNTLYTGITPDLRKRLATHNAGKGAAYTAARRPVTCLGTWAFPDRSAALKAERAFKKLSRADKLAHIQQQRPFQSVPFQPISE